MVRNPMNYHQVSEVILIPELVDCIVFWTKDPREIIDRLGQLDRYQYYFHVTITPYDRSVEPRVPSKKAVVESFKELSNKVGKQRVIWRYDPIILTHRFNLDFHASSFSELAALLTGYTDRCVISFLDVYKKIERNVRAMGQPLDEQATWALADKIAAIAERHNIVIESCCEVVDLSFLGIRHGRCIDDRLISEITGKPINVPKDKGQRKACGCVASVDIGAYNTCRHGCLYCYANFSAKAIESNVRMHDTRSPLLVGEITPHDKVKRRKVPNHKANSLGLFPDL